MRTLTSISFVIVVLGLLMSLKQMGAPNLRVCSNANPTLGTCQVQTTTFYSDIDLGLPRQINPTVTLYKGTIGAPCGTVQCQLVNPQTTPVFINL